MYVLPYEIRWVSQRYGKVVTVPPGFESNGADWALDIWTEAWWVHDWFCRHGVWDDGSSVTNWEASSVLADILTKEGRWFRARYWWLATWIAGCAKARRNGMWPWSRP